MAGELGSMAGVRIADFSRVLAGPYATMLLADLGADVVKIESPDGDDTRAWAPPTDARGMSTYFASVNRNKRSVVLDLKGPGLAVATELASTADVVVENFRPGTMARFGLDYDTLRKANPGVIYCSISGFGEAGGASLPGYDLLVQALGGLMSVTGEAGGEPVKAGVALVDVITGLHCCVGVQAALLERASSGIGQRVSLNLLSSLISALVNQSASAVLAGVTPQRLGNAHPSIAPYETFRAADRELVIAVGNNHQFDRLAEVLSRPDLPTDQRFRTNAGRVAHREALRGLIETELARRTASHWSTLLLSAGVPAGEVNSIPEAITLAHSLGLDPVSLLSDGSPTVSNPIGLSRTPARYDAPAPRWDPTVVSATWKAAR